jgi:peptide/nickel transport system permease protein
MTATSRRTRSAWPLALLLAFAALVAPALAPLDPEQQFTDYPYAPPMAIHARDASGAWHAPFVYRHVLVDPIERRYEEDRTVRFTIRPRVDAPVFLLGSDALGRDVLSRVLAGTRLSLGLALLASALSLVIGTFVGGTAGYTGGVIDDLLMRVTDFVLVLPLIYVALALRGAMPLVLSTAQVFGALVLVLGLVGWPTVARGVRGIVRVERGQEYAVAARAIGAGPLRVLVHHLAPAARGFLIVQAMLLVPAFVMAEATLSFAGLGFAPPAPSWGAMLQDASAVRVVADAPWLLAPAAAIVTAVLVIQLGLGTAATVRISKTDASD